MVGAARWLVSTERQRSYRMRAGLGGAGGLSATWWIDHQGWTDVPMVWMLAISALSALAVAVATSKTMAKLMKVQYGAIYLFRVERPPRYRRTVNGYVGKTVRRPEVRRDEHLYGTATEPAKPWADTVVSWRVVWQADRCSALRLHLMELWFISTRLPLYNYMLNLHNPRRIPKWVQTQQRAQRDAARLAR